MRVMVNGEDREFGDGTTVASLLESLRGEPGRPPLAVCAVEVNRTLVPRREHSDRCLIEGDAVEIVTLVGGG